MYASTVLVLLQFVEVSELMLENIKEVLISIATNNPPFLYDYFMTVSGVFILCVFVETIIYRNHHKKNKEHEGIE